MEIAYNKQIKVTESTDIVVLGGGMAGVSAALAAAQLGKDVVIIERFGVLGGNATVGGVANFCGNLFGQGRAFDMITGALKEFGAINDRGRLFNHEILAVILPELLLRCGVKIMLHTVCSDVTVTDGQINEVVLTGASGLEAIRAKQFIDCTGEGVIARCAGFSVMKGGETGYQLPMSLMYFVRHLPPELCQNEVPEGWFQKIETEDDLPMTSRWPNGEKSNAYKIKIPMFDSTDTRSLTMAEIAGRRKMMSVLDYHQRVEKQEFVLDHCSGLIGIREGVRILGDYVLKVDDLRAGRTFDDVVAVGTYYLDGHKPDDDKRTYILPKDTLRVPPYGIPLRSLIAKDGKNLMMAGRCISADQLALSSARVMTTCSMTGQAAGVTAAIAIEGGVAVRDVDVRDVQKRLIEWGAHLDRDYVATYATGK